MRYHSIVEEYSLKIYWRNLCGTNVSGKFEITFHHDKNVMAARGCFQQ